MLQWLGKSDTRIIYNTMLGEKCQAVVRDLISGETKTYKHSIYAISNDARLAVTLDFARLHRLRQLCPLSAAPTTDKRLFSASKTRRKE